MAELEKFKFKINKNASASGGLRPPDPLTWYPHCFASQTKPRPLGISVYTV